MREMVANQRLEKLVWQWSDQLCGDLTQHILKDTLRLLNLRDIDEEFLKNIYVNKVCSHSTRSIVTDLEHQATIFESMMLKRARKKLVELLASLKPSGFLEKMVRILDWPAPF